MAILHSSGYGARGVRLLTDLAGTPFYTIVLESTFDSVSQWEHAHQAAKLNVQWRGVYRKLLPLTESGHREILTLVE